MDVVRNPANRAGEVETPGRNQSDETAGQPSLWVLMASKLALATAIALRSS